MEKGLLAIILHAHLPFVRHPEHPEFLEEEWLFEAISETYIPLLEMFESLASAVVPARITIGLTPPLCEMLSDELLKGRYLGHVSKLIELSEKEVRRTAYHPEMNATARMYLKRFQAARLAFDDRYNCDLLKGFRALADAGVIDIITSSATHALLPLIIRREARRAQIEVGRQNFIKHFGCAARGIWLPECAYETNLDELIREAGQSFFIADAHALMFGSPRPRLGIYGPVITPAGVAAFARDIETSRQVWSAESGYPGDPDYREFYRDLAYDADYDYIKPYLHRDGVRRNLGIKYHRVTGKIDLGQKEYYAPEWAARKAAIHAEHFLSSRKDQALRLESIMDRKPIIVSPYDAELFGHWWFEGPQFLNHLIRKIHLEESNIRLATPLDYLAEFPENQRQQPAASSWGAEGYNRVWINEKTRWMYKHQHVAEDRMIEMARAHPSPAGELRRALNQAARELLLAESSDWAFIITTGTAVEYAENRFRDHIYRFNRLYEMIGQNQIDREWLGQIESRDSIFPELDYRTAYLTDEERKQFA